MCCSVCVAAACFVRSVRAAWALGEANLGQFVVVVVVVVVVVLFCRCLPGGVRGGAEARC